MGWKKLVLLLWEQQLGAIEWKLLLLEFVGYCPGVKPVFSQTGVEGGQELGEWDASIINNKSFSNSLIIIQILLLLLYSYTLLKYS